MLMSDKRGADRLVCQRYEYVLSELGPWCLAEQDFCVRFFNLTAGSDEDSAQVSQRSL